jgi:tetratricopeptide (TPR) repeat protein
MEPVPLCARRGASVFPSIETRRSARPQGCQDNGTPWPRLQRALVATVTGNHAGPASFAPSTAVGDIVGTMVTVRAVLLTSVVTISLTLALPSAAFGQRQNPREIQARKDCSTGSYVSGTALLAELYAETGDENFVFNQARCYQQNGRPDEAIERFREYLRIARYPSPDETTKVERHIAECKAMKVAQAQQRGISPAETAAKTSAAKAAGLTPPAQDLAGKKQDAEGLPADSAAKKTDAVASQPGAAAKQPEKTGGMPEAAVKLTGAAAKREARKHFQRGVELLSDEQVGEALLEFQRSYELKPHFAVLYNIGQAQSMLGRPIEAVDTFKRYLSDGGKGIRSTRRKEVERDIASQKARIATLEIRATPVGATITMDGQKMGSAPLPLGVRVAIGEHAISATAEGYDPGELKVTVAGGDYRVIQLPLVKHVEPPPPPPPAPPPVVLVAERPVEPPTPSIIVAAPPPVEPESQSVRRMRIAGLVTAGAGVAVVATGAGLLLKAKSDHDAALDHCTPNCDASSGSLQSRADRYLVASEILLFTGGAALVTGGTLYFLARHRAKASVAHAQVLPVLGPGFAGLAARGGW